ncbi:MAG: hypothetical protein A3J28_12185 [Acidobacteria bacterium RIFCSPLOWO2_12_FULL_60_22]|nr:MAG: hypothetical protein A3J28_12185 [Acidobacteria bacterium RIFCSPLOWO2_12_FULL_60_22]
MKSGKIAGIIFGASVGIVCWGGFIAARVAGAQSPAPQDGADNLQRSLKVYTYTTIADSGPLRGEEIYFNKCWVCHNEYQKSAPVLRDLYKRPKMVTGEPINDQTVAGKIRDGGPRMPAYRHTLGDADVADLLTYFREGKCCYDPENPPVNTNYRNVSLPAVEVQGRNFRGGPRGVVRTSGGEPLEGIMVQVIAENAVRTTVYSNERGEYEFPKLPAGSYTLRISRPLRFRPYGRQGVRINGAERWDDIVLERVSDTEFLPPTREIAAQLTGAEWLVNLPGTGQEKKVFSQNCGFGCHSSYEKILRNRFDERSWRLMLDRMMGHAGSLLIHPAQPEAGSLGRSGLPLQEEKDLLVKWLARIRGPEAQDPPLQILPGPRGAATRVIVTEYELPHHMLATHDAVGDSKGNIWYSSHRAPYIGKLDPRTGIVKEYRVPSTPGANPGQHWISVDQNDIVWFSENWSHKMGRFDPKTETFSLALVSGIDLPMNAPMGGNMGLAPDGYIWRTRDGAVLKIDPKTGRTVKSYPLQKARGGYGNEVSPDGNFFASGGWPSDIVVVFDIRKEEALELQTPTLNVGPARGGFDPQGNIWFGGKKGGLIVKYDVQTRQLKEYVPPTPYVLQYEVKPDKNGEVWMGYLHGGRFARFNPRTERWLEYVLPEPYSHNRRTWIDNSTDPVTIWYVDHNGYLVRIEPLE